MQPHIEADLQLLPTEQSGRRAPIFTGYHSLFACDGRECDATHTLDTGEFAFPGETARVRITFRNPARQAGRLQPGQRFEIREESRVIARGEIRRLLTATPPG